MHLHRNNVEARASAFRFAIFMNETAPVSYQQASFTTQREHRSVPSGPSLFHELITFHIVQGRIQREPDVTPAIKRIARLRF